ncbi:unnamed protein product, partial [marine sediment metagenome]
WRGRVCHINLSRQNDKLSIYNALEGISDGIMTREKYDGGTFNFKVHWCIVYANWPPDVDNLSLGKWRIKKLVGKENKAKLVNIDPQKLSHKVDVRIESPEIQSTRVITDLMAQPSLDTQLGQANTP